jgi:hypothetical protein
MLRTVKVVGELRANLSLASQISCFLANSFLEHDDVDDEHRHLDSDQAPPLELALFAAFRRKILFVAPTCNYRTGHSRITAMTALEHHEGRC